MLSATSHQFRRGKVNDDRSCLYTSFRYVNGIWNTHNNEYVRSMAIDHICKNKGVRIGIECQVDSWNDEDEIEALALLFHKSIRLVSKTKTDHGRYVTHIWYYGDRVQSTEECVYILYDGETRNYKPLYVVNKQNLDEILTIFRSHDDEVVFELLTKFIRKELHGKKEYCKSHKQLTIYLDDGFIQFGSRNIVYEEELPMETNDETEQLFQLVVPDAGVNFIINQEIPDHADLSFSKTIQEQM